MKATLDELGRYAVVEQLDDELWVDRQRNVEQELTWTLNLLDRVEDDTRELHARMAREAKESRVSAYDTRWTDERESHAGLED